MREYLNATGRRHAPDTVKLRGLIKAEKILIHAPILVTVPWAKSDRFSPVLQVQARYAVRVVF